MSPWIARRRSPPWLTLLPTAEDRAEALTKVAWVAGPEEELGEQALAMLNRQRALLCPTATQEVASLGTPLPNGTTAEPVVVAAE